LNRASFCFYPRIPLPVHQPKSHALKLKPTTYQPTQTPDHLLIFKRHQRKETGRKSKKEGTKITKIKNYSMQIYQILINHL